MEEKQSKKPCIETELKKEIRKEEGKPVSDNYEISTDLQTVRTLYNEFFAYYLLHAIGFARKTMPTKHTLRLLRSVNRDAEEFFIR